MLGQYQPHPPQGYSIQLYSPINHPHPGNGLAILVHTSLAYRPLQLNTPLQAQACSIGLRKMFTICNLYINPLEQLRYQDVVDLTRQLPTPFLLLGDMNSKHPLWGGENVIQDQHGSIFEQLLINEDIGVLNRGDATHYHIQTDTYSAIDLSLCSADLLTEFGWRVLEDLPGSDHYPLIIEEIVREPVTRDPNYIMK